VPVKQTCIISGLSEVSVRHWFASFRLQLPKNEEVLQKVVQLDEAYFGGKEGRTLFMAKQPGSRRLAFEILPHVHPIREEAWMFLQKYVMPQSILHTDGAGIYDKIDYWWPVEHKTDIHKKWEFELTSEIEGMFGVLRTFIRRMYHHVTVDKLPELVCEFCYRFSYPEIFENPRQYLSNTLRLVTTR